MNGRHARSSRVTWLAISLLAVLALGLPGVPAGAATDPVAPSAPDIAVKSSEKLDALFMLNLLAGDDPLLGGDPRFLKYEKVEEKWKPLLEAKAEAKEALAAWKGEAMPLAYILGEIGGDKLADLLTALAKPEEVLKAAEAGIDTPELKKTFEHLTKDHAKLVTFLRFLQDNDFSGFWTTGAAPAVDKGTEALRDALRKFDQVKFRAAMTAFAGPNAIDPKAPFEIYVAVLSGAIGGRLRGMKVAVPFHNLAEFGFILCQLATDRLVPSEANVAALKTLAGADELYGKVHKRIYEDMKQPPGAEYLLAATYHLGVAAGILSKKQALRQIKFAFGLEHGMPPEKAGSPVAGIVFDELSKAPPAAGFDFNAFVAKLHADGKLAGGKLVASYEAALAEVLGIAGLSLGVKDGRLVIVKVVPGFPAAEGGLQDGDEILAISGTELFDPDLNKAMELLSGGRGDEKVLKVRRVIDTLEIKFKLK